MEIGRHITNADPGFGRRQIRDKDSTRVPSAEGQSSSAAQSANGAKLSPSLAAADIERYVQVLKDMDPTDLHRLEDLQQRIADGSYSSDMTDQVDDLLGFLDEGE